MKTANKEEAKKLIKKYREEAEKIRLGLYQEEEGENMEDVAEDITGFGSTMKCILCNGVGTDEEGFVKCKNCIHSVASDRLGIYPCSYHNTYSRIEEAENLSQLASAFEMRAEYLEELLEIVRKKEMNLTEKLFNYIKKTLKW